MSTFFNDVRFGLRALARRPAFAAVVVATLGLGIGANTVIYGVVDGVILHPYPVPDGDRLVTVGSRFPRLGATELSFVEHISPAEYVDIREQVRPFERVVAWDMGNRQVSLGEATANLFTGFWWGDGLATLGVEPWIGRGMTPGETLRGDPVAVLSHRVWRDRFGADSTLVGGTISMNGAPYTVVGIMPPQIVLYGMDLWIPMGVSPEVIARDRRQWQVLARVRDGFDLDAANAELAALAERTARERAAEFEEYEGWRLEAVPWTEANTRQFRAAGFVLLGAVGFVLLLVCSNVASLLLSRASSRRREMAVRTALGAGRGRILGQLLTESVTLGVVGGAVGVGLAWFGVREVADLIATVPFVAGTVELNGRVLLFTAGISVLAGVLFGLAPALRVARSAPASTLRSEGSGSTGSRRRFRLHRALVGVEVALALLLLAGGGLFVNSLARLNAVETGFREEGVLSMRLTLARERYASDAVRAFFEELEDRVRSMPGVTAAGVGSQFPPIDFSRSTFQTERLSETPEGQLPVAMTTIVSPAYFETLGIPLLRGRTFTAEDVPESPPVAVLNRAAVDLLFPGVDDPLGRRIRTGPDEPWIEVVGVVGTTANRGLEQPPSPEVFGSHLQLAGWSNQFFLLVRTAGDPRSALPGVREQVRQMDSEQPIYAIRTVEEALAAEIAPRRIATAGLGIFAAFALVLAAVGIYGVVSFGVAQRTREIGVRMALGAGVGKVRGLMVRQALVPVAIGAVVGLLGALALGRAIEGLLFEVSGTDPATLVAVTGLLALVALAASLVPAVRASRIDPARTLREE